MGVVLRQAWSESQWKSQQMLDAIKHITDDKFFFQEDSAQVHCVCNKNQLSESHFRRFAIPRFAR